ncbi:MAG: tetratricopeptide repeat protein [Phycisphaeraceae bacterium]|nr:tetratricopeptide repeat protein [Phycisphaerales bacterium]MCB9860825.1 tetratricopeptide repeat protein [Phycisphaeraceae bacterium]
MLGWIVENTLLALVLVGVCIAAGRLVRSRPAVLHVLWLLVMVRLVLPPITVDGWPPKPIRAIANQTYDAVSAGSDQLLAFLVNEPAEFAFFTPKQHQTPGTVLRLPDQRVQVELLYDGTPVAASSEDTPYIFLEGEQNESIVVDIDTDNVVHSAAQPATPSFFSRIQTTLRSIPVTFLLVTAWILGALVIITRQLHSARAWCKHTRTSVSTTSVPPHLRALANDIARSMGMPEPRLKVCDTIVSPMVVAFGRATIYWPSMLTDTHAVRDHRAALAHELAHLKRRDHWVAWFEIIALSLCWWHPLMWYARSQMRKHAELSCDAWAVWVAPAERGNYARSLLSSVERSSACVPAIALGLSDCNRRMLERRLRQIMVERTIRSIGPVAALTAAVVFAPLLPSLAGMPSASLFFSPNPTPIATYDAEIAQVVQRVRELKRADSYYQVGKWNRAAELYQSYLDMVSADESVSKEVVGKAQNRLGNALLYSGQPDLAREWYEAHLTAGYAQELAHFGIACCESSVGHADAAVKRLQSAIMCGFRDVDRFRTEPSLASIRYSPSFQMVMSSVSSLHDGLDEIERFKREGNFPAVGGLYKSLTETAPNHGELWNAWATFQLEFRNTEGALENFQRQLSLEYKKDEALYGMAHAFAIAGDLESAVDHLHQAIDAGFTNYRQIVTNPDFAELNDNASFQQLVEPLRILANLREHAKEAVIAMEYDDAVVVLNQILSAQPHTTWPHGWANNMLGTIYLSKDKPDTAITFLLNQIELGYAQHNATYNLACAYAAKKDMERALSYLDASVDLGFTDVEHMLSDDDLTYLRSDARFHLIAQKITDLEALKLFGSVDWDDLESNARERLDINARDGRAWLMLGWSQLRHRKLEDAITSFQKQSELGFAPNIAVYNIACAHALAGRVDEAFPYLEQAIDSGMMDYKTFSTDADLWSLRADPRFEKLLEKCRKANGGDVPRIQVRNADSPSLAHRWSLSNLIL